MRIFLPIPIMQNCSNKSHKYEDSVNINNNSPESRNDDKQDIRSSMSEYVRMTHD